MWRIGLSTLAVQRLLMCVRVWVCARMYYARECSIPFLFTTVNSLDQYWVPWVVHVWVKHMYVFVWSYQAIHSDCPAIHSDWLSIFKFCIRIEWLKRKFAIHIKWGYRLTEPACDCVHVYNAFECTGAETCGNHSALFLFCCRTRAYA